MLPQELQTRKVELQKALGALSGGVEILRSNVKQSRAGEVYVEFTHSARIQKAQLRFALREEFRDLDTMPLLYAFSYHVAREEDVGLQSPLFRYECHPELGDPPPQNQGTTRELEFESPYSSSTSPLFS
jgi:hypothetical protein